MTGSCPRHRAVQPLLAGVALILTAPASAQDAPEHWQPLAAGAAQGEIAAVAFDAASGRVALGDERGVLVGREGAFERVLRSAPVRDLVFGADALWAATDRGLARVTAEGRVELVSPAPGEAARSVRRIAISETLVAVATDAGAFVSVDSHAWQRIDAFPSGPAGAITLRELHDGAECWAVIDGELWRARLRWQEGRVAPVSAQRESPAFASAGDGPVDLAFVPPGADLVAVFARELAVRRFRTGAWEVLRPSLPPGSAAQRLRAAGGRLWLATDRGLLRADSLAGPWRRAGTPVGNVPTRDAAGDATRVIAGTRAGAFAAAHATASADAHAGAAHAFPGVPRQPARSEVAERSGDPPIGRVHAAAISYLGLGATRLEAMRSGVRRRGWLPVLGLRLGQQDDYRRTRELDESLTSGALQHLVDRDRDRSRDREVQLTLSWDLGDVAFHPEEIDVSRETREVIELRDDVLDEITQLYFERRRVLAELADQGDPLTPAARRLRIRAAELAAGIDSWTGGWFGRQLGVEAP